MPLAPAARADSSSSPATAIVLGMLLCGVLDLAAACVQAWTQAGRPPTAVVKGIASAVAGRAALDGGPEMIALGLTMHFAVALTATLVFYLLSQRLRVLRTAPLILIGPLYGVVVFAAMNYATLPFLSWLRSVYLGTAARWPGGMGWPLLFVHLVCVGLPIVWSIRRAR